jgi:hypothetical protein
MARVLQPNAHLAKGDHLARLQSLLALTRATGAKPRGHHRERGGAGQHSAMPGASMVGMRVRDNGAVDTAERVDEEVARHAE